MLRIFDFKCVNGHVFEAFVDSELRQTPCKECTEVAVRVISPVRSLLDPISGTFPGATMKWARNREQTIAKERKAAE